MSDNKYVTILMTVRNGGKYIQETLDSIMAAKTVGEIIILNDNSDDNTQEIIIKQKSIDSRIKIISSDYHIGLDDSVEILWRHTRNPYICTLPADDIMIHDKFDDMSRRFFGSDLTLSLIFGRYQLLEGGVVRDLRHPGWYTARPLSDGFEHFKNVLINDLYIFAGAMIMDKRRFPIYSAELVRQSGVFAGDLFYFIQAFLHSKQEIVSFYDDAVALHRRRDDQRTSKDYSTSGNALEDYLKIIGTFRESIKGCFSQQENFMLLRRLEKKLFQALEGGSASRGKVHKLFDSIGNDFPFSKELRSMMTQK